MTALPASQRQSLLTALLKSHIILPSMKTVCYLILKKHCKIIFKNKLFNRYITPKKFFKIRNFLVFFYYVKLPLQVNLQITFISNLEKFMINI